MPLRNYVPILPLRTPGVKKLTTYARNLQQPKTTDQTNKKPKQSLNAVEVGALAEIMGVCIRVRDKGQPSSIG